MATVNKTLEKLLADVFDKSCDIADDDLRAKQRADFVFHMTDWSDDLQRLAELYGAPEQFDDEEAKDVVSAVLYHALGHLIAAARLYDYVPDPFAETSPEATQRT